jgi:hypothetical protein
MAHAPNPISLTDNAVLPNFLYSITAPILLIGQT